MFLIRTNVEDEGWTTDGIFGVKEATAQVAAILESAQYASHEGHHFEYRVYFMDAKAPMPRTTIKVDRPEFSDVSFYVSGNRVLAVSKPAPLDY